MRPLIFFFCLFAFAGCGNPAAPAATAADSTAITKDSVAPARPPDNFKDQVATVNGVKIHYVIGGTGAPLLLLHGFGQNWYMWNRLLPEFSRHFTVIAPDLPGSASPAERIPAMTRSRSPKIFMN